MQDLQPGTILNNRYRIIERLGEGGFAVVYAAQDQELNRKLALKFLKLSERLNKPDTQRLLLEARALAELKHPNIILVYSLDLLTDGQPFIVMEYLEGKPLSKLITEKRKFSALEAKSIVLQICRGLSYAHEKSIIHRDLSPANIFICHEANDCQVKILDFGLAKFLSESDSLTKTGLVLGNPPYMSPEQSRGNKASCLSDIYSFGLVCYELYAGHNAFDSSSTIGYLYLQQSEYPKDPNLELADKDEQERVKAIILRCIQKEPERRFQSVLELKAAIETRMSPKQILKGLSASDIPWKFEHKKAPKKLNKLAAISVLLFLALFAIVFQEQCICAAARIIPLLPANTANSWAQKIAPYLISRKKSNSAIELYQSILNGNAETMNLQSYESSCLALASLLLARGQRKEAISSLHSSWQHILENASPEFASDFIDRYSILMEKQVKRAKPAIEELTLQASMLNYLLGRNSLNEIRLRGSFDSLLKDSLDYAKTAALPQDCACPSLAVLKSLRMAISTPGFILKRHEQHYLSELFFYCAPKREFKESGLLESTLANPGVSGEYREEFEYMQFNTFGPDRRAEAGKNLIKKPMTKGRKTMILGTLARDAMNTKTYKLALKYLEMQKTIDPYPTDNELERIECLLGLGNGSRVQDIFKEMNEKCRANLKKELKLGKSSLDERMEVYRDLVMSTAGGYVKPYLDPKSISSDTCQTIACGVLLGRYPETIQLMNQLIIWCRNEPRILIDGGRNSYCINVALGALNTESSPLEQKVRAEIRDGLLELQKYTVK